MAERDRSHVYLDRPGVAEPYARPPRAIEGRKLPPPDDRVAHATRLAAEIRAAQEDALERRADRQVTVAGAIDGIFIVFDSLPGLKLALTSLEPQQGRVHPELRSVRLVEVGNQTVERATVFIPDGTLGRFLKRLDQYVATADQDTPRNANLVDRIRSIGLATLRELWTDPANVFPATEDVVWWELWLRRRDGHEVDRLRAFAEVVGLRTGRNGLGFADRTVALVEATPAQLARALDVLDDLAELRKPRGSAAPIAMEAAAEQAEWVAELVERTQPAPEQAPATCIVDTGVHQPHPMLAPSLETQDCHTCVPNWNTTDHDGHGTEMAGIALYGDIGAHLLSPHRITLRHRLESVKLLPPHPQANPPELYGALTATAASLVEIQAPLRQRTFSLATTALGDGDAEAPEPSERFGSPSSWSAALDALAAGLSIETRDDGIVFLDDAEESAHRLFVVAAGNIRTGFVDDFLARCDLAPIEEPGQAWNALTVGACTDLDSLHGAEIGYEGYRPLAPRGDLSPLSRTSVAFSRKWPIKPDVVLEGGNVARSQEGTAYDTPEMLQLLTTNAPIRNQRLLTVTNGTSAATAEASHLAANIMAEYPAFWPETVRALIVHSAEWSPVMRQRFDATRGNRTVLDSLHRRYGMGIPDLTRATRSATDALTLVVQDVIHPFDGEGRMREMQLHALPWPTEVLADLGAADVRMRITLSYFVEPNPGNRGWTGRYTYPSHNLRFDVRRPTESTGDFRKRVNQKALAEEERRPRSETDATEWLFGPERRVAGSLHTDIWTGSAADLAQRGAIIIYPVTGWWKLQAGRDHSERGARYSLIVSIDTPEQDVDIWTPVAQEVGIPIEIEI